MMKKIVSLILTIVLAFSCCLTAMGSETSTADYDFTGFNDDGLYTYLEDEVYESLINELGDGEYFVENVSMTYISEEYLEEVAYNSKANIYFGYNLADLQDQFEGTKYVFCLDEESGETGVKEFEEYDDTFDQVLRNVAVGTGVILVCVTISVVTAGVGATAISMIFAAAAETGTVEAITGGVFSGVTAGIITGIETGDMDEALKSAALAGSEGFKWGAIMGALSGGTNEAIALKGATLNGLTMNEAAMIQKESGYPLDVIKQFKSVDEYYVYKDAGLYTQMVDGKLALVQEIDLTTESVIKENGEEKIVTNLVRMQKGYAPVDANGASYELHHIGQKADATLAILTDSQHSGNATILNMIGKESEIDREAFKPIRKAFWKSYAKIYGGQ